MLSDSRAFLLGLWRHWLAVAGGGAISMAIFMAEHLMNRSVPWRVIVIILAAGLFIACFLVWRDEHRRVESLEDEKSALEAESRAQQAKSGVNELPDFHVALDEVSIGSGLYDSTVTAFALLVVRITNTGAPSVASEFRFSATPLGGVPVFGRSQVIQDGLAVPHQDIGAVETIAAADALPQKAQGAPIEKGSQVRGRMLYALPGIEPEALGAGGTMWELWVSDAWGTWYKGSRRSTGTKGIPLGEFPGLQPRFRGSSDPQAPSPSA